MWGLRLYLSGEGLWDVMSSSMTELSRANEVSIGGGLAREPRAW